MKFVCLVLLGFAWTPLRATELLCPDEYVLEGLSCVKKTHVDVQMRCTEGYSLFKGTSEVVKVFEHHGDLVDGGILPPINIPVILHNDSKMAQKMSTTITTKKTQKHKYTSGVPRRLYSNNEHVQVMCERTVESLPVPHCEEGLHVEIVDDKVICTRVYEDVNIVKSCPNGFQMGVESGLCERVKKTEPMKVCVEGYKLTENGCVEIIVKPVQLKCKEGYKLYDNKCMKVDTTSVIVSCPRGTRPSEKDGSNRCIATKTIKPKDVCSMGFELMNGECVKMDAITPRFEKLTIEITSPAILVCEEGYVLNELNECIIKKAPKPVCPEGTGTYDPIRKLCVRNKEVAPLCPERYARDVNGMCLRRIVEIPSPQCPLEYNQVNNLLCTKTEYVKPQKLCPDTYHLHNDTNCMKPIYTETQFFCDIGYTINGNKCTKSDVLPHQLVCPEPFKLSHNGKNQQQCTRVTSVPPILACPIDTTNVNGKCIILTQIQPVPVCDVPFLLNIRTGMCEEKEIVPAKPYCPANFEYDMSLGSCVGWTKVKAKKVLSEPAGEKTIVTSKKVVYHPKKILYGKKLKSPLKFGKKNPIFD